MLFSVAILLALGNTPPPAAPASLTLEASPTGFVARLERGGVQRPWPMNPEWVFVRSGGGQENVARPSRLATGVRLPVPSQSGALTVVGVDLAPRIERFSADRWADLLEQQAGLVAEVDGAPVRVRRIESAKALLRHTGGPPSGAALSKTGQEVELRAVADPTTLAAFGDLPLRGYAPGGAGGAFLRAVHAETGDLRTGRLDAQGLGYLRLGLEGRWVITMTVARPLARDLEADWELSTATLSFDAGRDN